MKSKKIILVTHCILNQNSVVEGWARARGAYPIAELLIKEGVGIIQLPCPELLYGGINRLPLSFKDYNTKEYRELCRELLQPYVRQVREYLKNGFAFLGIIAVENSPTCSVSGERGIMIEELISLLKMEGIPLPYAEIPESYQEGGSGLAIEQKITKLIGS